MLFLNDIQLLREGRYMDSIILQVLQMCVSGEKNGAELYSKRGYNHAIGNIILVRNKWKREWGYRELNVNWSS